MANLIDWPEIEAIGWPNLITGNGFSVCIDRCFSYNSLYEFAENQTNILTPDVLQIFRSFNNTTNFEEVLDRLNTAKTILSSLGYNDVVTELEAKYDIVKTALIECVNRLHPGRADHINRLRALTAHLATYENIYTTNYDLLLYWSIMEGEALFKDYFWNAATTFDLDDTALAGTQHKCLVHYIHGALPLFKTDRSTRKIKATATRSLLERITENMESRELPLFISEGNFQDKLRKIRSSDYLNFCLEKLGDTRENIVVFGHSLSPQYDRHLLDEIKKAYHRTRSFGGNFRIAVSIYNEDRNLADAVENIINEHVSRDIEKHFFRSETHPISLAR